VSQRVEEQFNRLRRGPWYDDPLGAPQQRSPFEGQVESQGFISDNAITADTIQANAVIAGKIDADAVTAREIAANTITANEIAANTITAAQIAADTITANEIAANAITASEIAANAVTADEIAANTITAAEIAADTITANEIAASAITATELAADSVITSKILAGNVTSSRIELTISGKNFGANSGSTSAPGVYCDAESTTGMYRFSAGAIGFVTNGNFRAAMYANELLMAGHVMPEANVTYDIGSSTLAWDTVYRFTEASPSDERLKYAIVDSPIGLKVIRDLRPRGYRWRDTVDTQARDNASVDHAALVAESRYDEQRIERIRALQQAGRMDDANANVLVGESRRRLAAIVDRHNRPLQEAMRKRRPGRRLHYGLIAQEVKQTLDRHGIDPADAAFWREESNGMLSLSYTELIAPMLKAIQELADEVDAVKKVLHQQGDQPLGGD